MTDVAPSATRRGLLTGIGVGATSALAGCTERLWSQAESTAPDQVAITIKTVPADDDRLAAAIASQLRENYEAAGIDATHEPVSEAELYRDVLLEGDYDVFVARHPGLDDPDALYGLLHSRFVTEQGWQNPFNFSDVTADDHLERQRLADGDDREDSIVGLIDHLLETAPYTTVAFPYAISGVREDMAVPSPPHQFQSYLEVMSHEDNGPREAPLEVGTFGERLTERLNPLVVDRNRIEGLLDLLYDPLARRIDGEYVPWLAEAIEWDDGPAMRAEVTLREGLTWHDGEPLDAGDVAFTYEFLADTSMGGVDGGVPASRYRDRETLVETIDVDTDDSRTVLVEFRNTTRAIAQRALTVPLLPEHVWADRSEVVADRQTRALVVDNVDDDDPVGSGLFAVADATTNVELELEPFEDHVLREIDDPPGLIEGFPRFDGVRFRISPNAGSMVEALLEGESDVTVGRLPPDDTRTVQGGDGTSTVTGPTEAFYMIGYNSHHPELGNPRFRRACSRLLDRDHIVAEFFDGYGRPATSPNALVGIRDQAWSIDDAFGVDTDRLSFPGSDGELDTTRVRSLFTDIGYSYEDDALLE